MTNPKHPHFRYFIKEEISIKLRKETSRDLCIRWMENVSLISLGPPSTKYVRGGGGVNQPGGLSMNFIDGLWWVSVCLNDDKNGHSSMYLSLIEDYQSKRRNGGSVKIWSKTCFRKFSENHFCSQFDCPLNYCRYCPELAAILTLTVRWQTESVLLDRDLSKIGPVNRLFDWLVLKSETCSTAKCSKIIGR